jgi:pimeloyl-ACP methyl ester carboxylesterase
MHEAMVASYIRNASHVPLDDDVLDAFSRPWLGDRGQAAFYRQIAQADERFTNEVQPRYGEIRVPVLIIWGEEDRWIDVTQAHVLGELIGGAEVTVVPAAGHLVQEDAPDETARHLARFLLDRRRAAD